MTSTLYPEVLGEDWLALDGDIQCAHATGVETMGSFRITYGTGWAAKWLACRSNLPQEAEAAETRLKIVAEDTGERWERQFDAKAFTTRQWKGKDGLLVERFGEWELHFKLRVKDGGLFYEQAGARLCLGVLHIPMPLFCAPRVVASERQDGVVRVAVSVRVTLPLVGLLIAYEGHLNVKGNIV